MARVVKLPCVLCGTARPLRWFGLDADGALVEPAKYEPILRVDNIGGRGRLTVERHPLPLDVARGLRAALVAALERLDADIAAASDT